MTDVPKDPREILETLNDRMSDLTKEIRALNEGHEKVRKSTVRQRIYIAGLVIAFLLGVTVLSYRSLRNQDRIEAQQDRIEAQQIRVEEIQARTGNEVLCPLYQIFINAINNPSPEQKALRERDPAAKATADKAREVILHGFTILECKPGP